MNAIIKWMENILIVILICIIILALVSLLHIEKKASHTSTVLGYQPLTILSGSMRPVIEPGDMILIRAIPSNKIKVGDIVSYWADKETLITHRVTQIKKNNGRLQYKTKGDANQLEDQECIYENMLLGRMVLSIPKGGYISKFVRSKIGFILLIIMPTIILTVTEIRKIIIFNKIKNKANKT